MIILKLNKKIKYINQNIYDYYVTREFLQKLLKDTPFSNFTIHGHYSRNSVSRDSASNTILVTRIQLEDTTHTILLAPMVPYLSCSVGDLYQILSTSSIPSYWPISNDTFYRLKRKFNLPFSIDTFYTVFYNHYFFIPLPT